MDERYHFLHWLGRWRGGVRVCFFFLACCGLSLFVSSVRCESARKWNQQGLEAFGKEDYSKALEHFKKAGAEEPENLRVDYNVGAANARQGKNEEALAKFEKVSGAREKNLAARAHFAKGVIAYRQAEEKRGQGDLQAALREASAAQEANKDVLRAAPGDNDARVNLELSNLLRKEIEKQLQQQQRQQQDKQQQEGEKKEEKKEEDKKDENQRQEQGQNQPEKQQDQQKEDQKQQDQQQQDQQKQDQEKQDRKEQDRKQQEKKSEGDSQSAAEKAPPRESPDNQEQMERNAALSVLNLLDDNDVEAVKRMLRQRYSHVERPAKDW